MNMWLNKMKVCLFARSLLTCKYRKFVTCFNLRTNQIRRINYSRIFYLCNNNKPKSEIELGSRSVKELLENAAEFKDDLQSENDVWSTPVYPVNADPRRDQAVHSIRPKVDPRTTSVVLFPGQGSQYVGMGKQLLEYKNVKEMYEIASQIAGYDLLQLCLTGPKEELDKTLHCQLAVVVTSLAAVERLKEENPEAIEQCVATAGFSVGEYAALVFAGALSFEDAIRLVKIRGQAMQEASEQISSGMMTVFFHPDAKIKFACKAAEQWCKRQGIEDPVCTVANYLYPECKVIAGNMEALKFIELNASDFGIKKLKYLPVSGAFHTLLMKPAEEVLKNALKNTNFNSPLIPVHSNIDGKPHKDASDIRKNLCKHVCKPVKWEQTLHILYTRPTDTPFPNSFVCGPDRSLQTLLRMVNLKAWKSSKHVET
ncbi:probable malonyl-CoA-acyl carrier protein transacylase, mitochondrial [Centruroides sculpturatus]|uniref:probable malonyl-CoA-acyl carrier protein transacylase, mitochondrial n=1 Tax=Centruroides sculpturatus TaxID=218467 RepID=UPI000C6EE716|nr:probable malonyl-CoA-acyl carrier protein transacylase, mitochondrial [Centruroides sculpturatus]